MDYHSSLTVLIAGDALGDVSALNTLLELDGHIVVGHVSSWNQVVTAVQQQQPDLVLLDVNAIDLDGIDPRQIKALEGICPIVFLGASPLHALPSDKLERSVYLCKPVGQQELEQAIDGILFRSLETPNRSSVPGLAGEMLRLRWSIRRAVAYVARRNRCSQAEAMERIHQEARAKRARLADVASAMAHGEAIPYCHDAPV
jgi:AmiR/NasT family two-component response regulator